MYSVLLCWALLPPAGGLNYRLSFGKNGPPAKAKDLEEEDDETLGDLPQSVNG